MSIHSIAKKQNKRVGEARRLCRLTGPRNAKEKVAAAQRLIAALPFTREETLDSVENNQLTPQKKDGTRQQDSASFVYLERIKSMAALPFSLVHLVGDAGHYRER